MTCMYNRDEQCFEDCTGCPRATDVEDVKSQFGYYDDMEEDHEHE